MSKPESHRQLEHHIQTIIDAIKDTMNTLHQQHISNPGILLTNTILNNNAHTFAFNPIENDILIVLTEIIENILQHALPSLDILCRKYLVDVLYQYQYSQVKRKFTTPLTINNLYTFLNDLEGTGHSLDAFQAAWNGEIRPVRKFIKTYPQFKDKPGIWGTTLLYSAARNNHLQLVDYLISIAHCSINAQNEQHIERALNTSRIISADVVDAPTAGSTALHGACFFQHLDIVRYLVEHGADYYITNHAEETAITNAKNSIEIEKYFRKFLILNYSTKIDTLPEKPIIEGGENLINDCIWEYKPFSDHHWFPFSAPEAIELSQSLKVPPDQQFQQEIHLKVERGTYGVSTVKFLRSGKGLNYEKNLAWIRCRGSSILNFDCYSIWQIMFIQHPSIESNSIPSSESFTIPILNDLNFKFKRNVWYNCPVRINSQLDKAINYRQKILSLNFPFINDQLKINLQTFAFTNSNQTILGFIRWIPKIISINEQNTNKITYLDNFKPIIDLNPIVMTSKHIINKDDKSLTGAEEHEMADDQSDTYDENLTNIEPEVKLEDYINEARAAAVKKDSLQVTYVDDLINSKLRKVTVKINELEKENASLITQIEKQMIVAKGKDEKQLAELLQRNEKLCNELKKLIEEQGQLQQDQKIFEQTSGTIQTANYENIHPQLVQNFLSPNRNFLLKYLRNISTINDQHLMNNVPKIVFEEHQTAYTITLFGFQNQHDQFKIILQRLKSLVNLIQSAEDFYQSYITSLMTMFSQVQSKTYYWILYKNIFTTNIKKKVQEYVTMFQRFIEQQTKILGEKSISNELTRPWIEIRKFTNQFIEDNPFINQIEQIKYQTLDQFIQQNISLQRVKKPTEQSTLTLQQMINKLTNIFQTDQQYRGHQLEHIKLIPSLLQRIIIYYCCFLLQLPLFESAEDLLDKIQNNTVTTICTTTGSGKSTLLPALLIAEGYDRVIVTQPHRLLCQLISQRVNETMTIDTNNKKENLAGWIVNDAKSNPNAKILYMTDDLLRDRLLYDDIIISTNTKLNKSIVICIDEVHERSISTDLCLAFLARLLTNRPELKTKLKIIISSATLDASIPTLFRSIVQTELAEFTMPQMGTIYPVKKYSHPNANILDIVQELYKQCQSNDQILCFANSALEATENCKLLSDVSHGTINVRPLIHSQSSKIQQDIIQQARVIFSTTIAETSLTFPSLKYVIDTGYIDISVYNFELQRTVLTTVRAAHSIIQQRVGRLGRTKPGKYYALYNFEADEQPFPIPQICLTDLTNIEFSLRRSPLKCGLNIIQKFLPDKPSQLSIDYSINTLRSLKILKDAPSDEFTPDGISLSKIPDFGSLPMSISVLSALRNNCGQDLICLSSILSVLNSTAIFSLIPQSFKSSDGDFMTLLNIMNKILLVKQSVPPHQFNLDRICEATQLTNLRHIIGLALKRYMSLEKSFNLSKDYCVKAHIRRGNWKSIARALLSGYSDNVFISMRELHGKHLVFARYTDLNDTAVLDPKSTLTRSINEAPVPLVLARDVLNPTDIHSRSIISFIGEIKSEWMDYTLQRKFILSTEEEAQLTNESRYTNARSLFSNDIHMELNNKTITLRGRSGVVLNAELYLRKEIIHEIKFELINRYQPNTTAHENLSRNLEKISKMPRIFDPMIWRWRNDKQVIININNFTSSKSLEITIKGRHSHIYKAKEEFDSFLSWLGKCAVIRNLDLDVSPQVLRPQCIDIEERISRVTDSKRTRIDLYNGTKGTNATRETRMEVAAWIAVCKFQCKLEGSFVRDWIVGKYIEHPLSNPPSWVQYQETKQIPYMVKEVVPGDLDCHLPRDSNFDIENFQDELHKYGMKCQVYQQAWRYVLLIDRDESTGPFIMYFIEPHVALTHDRIDFDVNNLYVEKDYIHELGMRIDIRHEPFSIELESIIDNIKEKRFRVLRPMDNTLRDRSRKMVDIRKWTQIGEPDSQNSSVLVPLPSSSALYKDIATKIQLIAGAQIKSIEQIKNPLLENAYEVMKHAIEKQCQESNPNERELFYGTKGKKIHGITDNGFDERYFSRTGRWGYGAYFADDPRKSHSSTHPDSTNETRVIFYAKVLLGNPSIQNKDNSSLTTVPAGFHSVQVTGDQYEEYIVYHYGQALPYLKITYRCDDMVNTPPNSSSQITNKAHSPTNTSSRKSFQTYVQRKNVVILYFGFHLPDESIFAPYETKSSNNPFKFIGGILSIKDKTIYLIVSTNKAHSVIPIVHKHYCVEKIYLYGSIDAQSSSTLLSMSEKISSSCSDLEKLSSRISDDIKITTVRTLEWDRSFDYFTLLHTQRLENQYPLIKIISDTPRDEIIVIYHHDNQKLFQPQQGSSPLFQFTDVNKCVQLINEQKQSQIFLIIFGDLIPTAIQPIFNLPQIHAAYFFRSSEFKYSINERKVSGLFNKLDDLSKQLCMDILFYREKHIHTSRIDVFLTIEQKQKFVHQLNDNQIAFLKYNLFFDILLQTPSIKYLPKEREEITEILFPNKGKEVARYINQLSADSDIPEKHDQDPKFSQIILRLLQIDKLNNLFIIQKPLIDIHNRVLKSAETSKSLTVYLAKIISNNDLEMIQSESDKFISIGIFVLATKSLLTARTIARKMADNGLTSVLFQIEVAEGIRLLEIDSDHVIFGLGTVFHFESINQAPDDVWYVKIKSAESEFRMIKERIQLEIDVPLSWLTYGNYLYFLKQPELAETYFEFLLEKLPAEHIDRLSIYNNMALIYTMENGQDGKTRAKEIYDDALTCSQSVKSDLRITKDRDQSCIVIPTSSENFRQTNFDRSIVLGSIADVHYQEGKYELALDHYKQALASSTDSQSRSYYQQMIATVTKRKEKT